MTEGASLHVLHMAHVRWYNAEAQYALDLAQEMGRQGHRVAFFAQTGSPAAQKAREAGLQTHEEAGFNAKGSRALAALPAAVRLGRLLRRERFDAVEVHRPEGLPLVAWACRRVGVPLVRVRGDMRLVRADPFNRFLHRHLLAAVVASNAAIAASLRDRVGRLPRLATIHGGVDPDVFRPDGAPADPRAALGLPADGLLVGILGRLGRVKAHDDFLEGARLALETGVRASFVILAKELNERAEELRQRIEASPVLRGRVGFLGHRPDLPAVLRAFDLGVVTSTGSEANCRVGLEWMASGVPLLATTIGVLPDLVVDGETGFLVPPALPSRVAEKIVYLADHRSESARMGAAARRRVLERFTLRHCAESHAALLTQVLREHRP